jgi:hypothetical protein
MPKSPVLEEKQTKHETKHPEAENHQGASSPFILGANPPKPKPR